MAEKIAKSVVTCDMEGRIETYNDAAVQIFGYAPEEVVGKKRVSLFSPGLVVLGHVNDWLKTAREAGEYTGRTVFVRKDGSKFAADIRITPTFRDGVQIGYCGVTAPRLDIPVAQAEPEISLFTRIFGWLVVTRAPFLTATIVPIAITAAWVAARGLAEPFPWLLLALTLVGGIALHVAANTFNDYFDWTSGTDEANNDYFLPLSGGSRSVELGLITPRGLFTIGVVSFAIALAAGLAVMAVQGPGLIVFGVIGALSAFFYTAPPVRLAARRGLGELVTGMNFGPLMTAGAVYALTGQVSWVDFVIGVPVGLLITAVLYINEFPDHDGDKVSGKHNLVVVLGKRTARWGYLALVLGAFALVAAGVVAGWWSAGALLALLALPVGLYAANILFKHYEDRSLARANSATIVVHVLAGALMAVGLVVF